MSVDKQRKAVCVLDTGTALSKMFAIFKFGQFWGKDILNRCVLVEKLRQTHMNLNSEVK